MLNINIKYSIIHINYSLLQISYCEAALVDATVLENNWHKVFILFWRLVLQIGEALVKYMYLKSICS